jgi:non-ribosomal peptide synthetase component E (peptide arylation enzyme)
MTKLIVHTPEMVAEFMSKGYFDELTLSDAWNQNAQKFPDKEGLVDPLSEKRFTWRKLKQLTDRLALNLIELGMKRDDVLASQLPNCVEHIIGHFACDKAGILFLGLRTALREAEMRHILKVSEATAVVIPWKFRDFDHFRMLQELQTRLPKLRHIIVVGQRIPAGTVSFEELMNQSPKKEYPENYLEKTKIRIDELADLMTTTGTTGMPKIAAHSGANLSFLGKTGAERFRMSSDEVVLTLVPYWSGISIIHATAAARVGAKSVVIERFSDPVDIFRAIEKEGVTTTISAPTVYFRMVEHPDIDRYDLSSLCVAFSAGASLSVDLARRVEERLRCKVAGAYGIVEGGFFSMHYIDDPLEMRLSTVGRIVDGLEVKVIDEEGNELPRHEVGEVVGRGTGIYEGSYNDPERMREMYDQDGFYHTGDLGRVDEMGNIILVGRRKDMIIRGGQNIYPVEIESLLLTHPSVGNVAVVGMPDPEMGEKACAFVVTKPGKQLNFNEMIAFLRGKKIASYKLPERLEMISEFPVAGESKVNKRELKEIIIKKLKSEGKI